MKKSMLLLLLLACGFRGYSQHPQKIDEYVSVDFPETPMKMDTVYQNLEIKQYISYAGDAIYTIQRLPAGTVINNLSNLPHDAKSLKVMYKDMEAGYLTGIKANGFTKLSAGPVSINGLDGYRIKTRLGKKPVGDAWFLVLGRNMYSINYINQDTYDPKAADAFFSSIKVAAGHPAQLLGKGPVFNVSYVIGQLLAGALILGGIIYLVTKLRRK